MSTTEIPSTLPGNVSLADHDPVMFDLIEKEKVGEDRARHTFFEAHAGHILGWVVVNIFDI